MSTLEFELDELQQYTRRPKLRIQGIEEDFRGEDLERKVLAVINSHQKKRKTTSKMGGLCEERFEKGKGGRKMERKGQQQGPMEANHESSRTSQ